MTVLRHTLTILIVGVAATTIGMVAAESAHASWKDWAQKWQKLEVKEHARVVRAEKALDRRVHKPAKPRSSFSSWENYGRYVKRRTLNWRENWWPYLRGKMVRPSGSGAARWWPLARYVRWPETQRSNLIRCVSGESGGNPYATNGPYHGLMQIGGGSYDPKQNLSQGLSMWRSRGWQPWGVMH